MKRTIPVLILAIATFLTAFQQDGEEGDESFARRLWSSISDYSSWERVPGTSERMPGQAPHGKFVTIYANQPALATLTSDSTAMPEGAVFAKSNFNSIGELENVTVMYRKLSGWVWLVYEPDGAVKRAGRLDDCLACHAGAEKDGVFSWGRR